MTFEFAIPATPGMNVEFAYIKEEEPGKVRHNLAGKPGFHSSSGNRWDGTMQSQKGIVIKIPELAGSATAWKNFYRTFTEQTEQPPARFVTARGTSGFDHGSPDSLI